MDEETGLTLGGTAIAADMMRRVLGPTADYLGDEFRGWVEHRTEEAKRIIEKARQKQESEPDDEETVPPRVAKGVFEEGPYFDNELGAEYFGGILAASRTNKRYDDRGSSYVDLISRLSSYQIAVHYLFYKSVRIIYSENDLNLSHEKELSKIKTFFPLVTLEVNIDLKDASRDEYNSLLQHIFFGLLREDLLGSLKWGPKRDLPYKGNIDRNTPGVVFEPTALGISLYLWAHGKGSTDLNRFLDESLDLISDIKTDLTSDIQKVKDNEIECNRIQV